MKLFVRVMATLLVIVSVQVMAEGDPTSGRAKSAICAACHGPDGNGLVPNWPKIAGQHGAYLERQLHLIKSNARSVPEMVAFVGALSDQDIADLAAFYASGTTTGGVAEESLVTMGKRIYQAGNAETSVPACMACHGPAGAGNPPAGYPALAGQHSVYTVKMLTQIRAGQNWGEKDAPSHVMNGASSELSDEEINAVASYIEGLYLVISE